MASSRLARGADEFGLCLLGAFAELGLAPFEGAHVRLALAVLIVGLLLFSLWTTAAPRRLFTLAVVVCALGVAAVARNEFFASDRIIRLVFACVAVLGILASIAVIAARVRGHARVTVKTTTGALTVYVLIGVMFAYVFVLIAVAQNEPFFRQRDEGSIVSFLYFSFTCLTTAGFGDLSARDDLGRMAAVLEALLGQLYLVTVVAVVVGNIGRARRAEPDNWEPDDVEPDNLEPDDLEPDSL